MTIIKKLASTSLVLVLLSVAAWAANKRTATINLSSPAKVGSNQLASGEYEVSWDGSGPSVDVTFSKGRRTVATVTAQLVEESSSSPYRNPATNITIEPDGTRMITQIRLRNASLVFSDEPQGQPAGGAGQR